jgi:glycosyltransferase involved in cell wall biosynthesis
VQKNAGLTTVKQPELVENGEVSVARNNGVSSNATGKKAKSLRIGVIAYSFYEGDNRIMRYAEALADRGDHVDVFALQRGALPSDETLEGVHLYRLQTRRLDEKGRYSYLRRITQFFVRATVKLTQMHRREKYDLIHVHSVPDFLVFTALAPKLSHTPVILDIHDILPEFYTSKFGTGKKSLTFRALQLVEKMSAGFSDHVIVANHIWQERLISRSVAPEKCTVFLNYPDQSIFDKRAIQPRNKERFVLLYPGTLNWHQGLDIAIRAFARISDKVPRADFHIYGEGPARAELENLVRELHMEKRISIRDLLPLREIAGVIGSADLGIVPKRKDAFGNEAFSTKILEFMSMGVPVVIADTKIDRYYFNDSIVSFFSGGDEEDLARGMLELIQDSEKRARQADNATRFLEPLTWEAKKNEYLSLVDKLIESHRS